MKYKKKETSQKRYFFAISTLVHILLLIIFFAYYKYNPKSILFPKKPAKVIFKKQQPKPKAQPRPKPKTKPRPKQKIPVYQGLGKQAPPRPSQKPKPLDKQKYKKPKPKEKIEQKIKKIEQKKPVIKQDKLHNKSIDIKKQLPKPTPIRKVTPIKKTKPYTEKNKPPKKDLTLADVFKGMSQYSEKQGKNLVLYKNAHLLPQGTPTEEQIRRERYLAKVMSCIHTMIKISRNTFEHHEKISPYTIPEAVYAVTINKNGRTGHIRLLRSSGIKKYDIFALNLLKEASKSFPPIPNYLHQDVITFGMHFDCPAGVLFTRNSLKIEEPKFRMTAGRR